MDIHIKLNTIDKVKRFIDIINNFSCEIDIIQNRYVIDAKSIMAIFSLNLSEELILRIRSTDNTEISDVRNAIEQFT